MKAITTLLFTALLLLASCSEEQKTLVTEISSPDGSMKVSFFKTAEGIGYQLTKGDQEIIDSSYLSIEIAGQPALGGQLEVVDASSSAFDESWETVWGEQRIIRNHYNELMLSLEEPNESGRKLDIVFRLYDDGLGFRYIFPEQEHLNTFVITDEKTSFKLAGDHTAWWIPADYDSYEYLYINSKISEVNSDPYVVKLAANTVMEKHATATPLTMQAADDLFISIHEAELVDYADMTLRIEEDKRTLTSSLVPAADGTKVKAQTPFQSPWRTIQVAETAAGLIESNLIVNLNPPNKLEDVSWIHPAKYIGIWWSHHLGETTWGKGEKQGATTENAMRHIDFAKANGFPLVLIEGWNTGWEHWFEEPKVKDAFDFVTPVEGYDLEKVVQYAKENGVGLVAHHETESSVENYEKHIEAAFDLLQEHGIHAVKTGYVRPINPDGEYHHGQWMVNHFRRVIEMGAEHEVMIVSHESIKPTGERRTYPNMLARECLRGSEYNSPGGGGNPPYHLTVVPFTRMLGGPIDYTPGLFNLDLDEYKKGYKVPTTLAYQLAEYIVLYGPAQMASDLPENYEGHPAFQFIKDVAVDWEQSKVLNGEIGQYITIARQERDGTDWFLGSLTNENSRTLQVPLDFLEEGATYEAQIYADGEGADFETNNMAYRIENKQVTVSDTLNVELARGGGQAIRFKKL